MRLRKPPRAFLNDSFLYSQFSNTDKYSKPIYKDPITIDNCRIDDETVFSYSPSGKTIMYNALLLCYSGITTPLPEFKEQSKVTFDGKDHIIVRVIPIKEVYEKSIYGYELEVV